MPDVPREPVPESAASIKSAMSADERAPGPAALSAVPRETDAQTLSDHERFAQIRTGLAEASPGATITVGFAESGEHDTLEGLIGRADAALIGIRTSAEPAPRDELPQTREGPASGGSAQALPGEADG